MLDLSRIRMVRDPYPFGIASHILPLKTYTEMVEYFPDEELYASMSGSGYNKLSLSERNNADDYHAFIARSPLWSQFHAYVKGFQFRGDVFKAIGLAPIGIFTSRFEFSSMPADGGFISPHTDIPTKVVTLVLPMTLPGRWDPAWGGGTDILKPRNPAKKLVDYTAELSEFDVAGTVHFLPNQALVFIKTKDSWHSAGPFTGEPGEWRRTLTINIERTS